MKLKLKRLENRELGGSYPEIFPGRFMKLNAMVRFLLGRPMDNMVRTDSSFWRSATRGYPSRWLRLPGFVRALVRLSVVYAFFLSLVLGAAILFGAGQWAFHVLLDQLTVACMIFTPLYLIRRVREEGVRLPVVRKVEEEGEGGEGGSVRRVRVEELLIGRRDWESEKVMPLARAVGDLLGLSTHPADVRGWLTIPRNYMNEGGGAVEILLPQRYVAQDKARLTVEKTASERLGMKEMNADWQLSGKHPRLLLRSPSLPPTMVTFTDVKKYLEAGEEYRPLMGMTGKGTALYAEMIADSPHIGLSAGPGAGKSAMAKLVIMQALHWGWGVVVLDWKVTKQFTWLEGLPGVTYLTDIEDIHDMGVRIGEEVDLRKRAGMNGRANVLVVRDEWNATSSLLWQYWDTYYSKLDPEEKKGEPRKSPALAGYAVLDFAGREFGLFDFLIAQKFSNRIFNGNTDMRECFNIKCLARYSPQTKAMLVGNMKPFPKKSNIPGRWTIVAGEEVAVVQAPWIENEEARQHALEGKPNPTTPFSSAHYPELDDPQRQPSASVLQQPRGQGDVLPLEVARGSEIDLDIDLALAVEEPEVLTTVDARKISAMVSDLAEYAVTYKIMQNARDRGDEGFPAPYGGTKNTGYTYDYAEVRAWARRRHARQRAEQEIR